MSLLLDFIVFCTFAKRFRRFRVRFAVRPVRLSSGGFVKWERSEYHWEFRFRFRLFAFRSAMRDYFLRDLWNSGRERKRIDRKAIGSFFLFSFSEILRPKERSFIGFESFICPATDVSEEDYGGFNCGLILINENFEVRKPICFLFHIKSC